MLQKLRPALLALVMALFGVGVVSVVGASASPGNDDNITFCHATASTTNPYVIITTDPASVIKRGHGDHTGPIFDPEGGKDQPAWGDVIPAFDYPAFGNTPAGHFAGLNATTEGLAFLAAGCNGASPSTEPPEETTTPPPTTTTPPPTTTTPPPETTSPPVETTTPPAATTAVVPPPAALPPPVLAETGASSLWTTLGIGMWLLLLGALVLLLTKTGLFRPRSGKH